MKKRNFPIWTILYKNLIWIIIVVLAFGVVSYSNSKKKKKPTYTVRREVLVYADIDDNTQKSTTSTASNNVTLADWVLAKVVASYQSPEAMEFVNWKINDGYYISSGNIGFELNDTLIFTMTYTDNSPENAQKKLDNAIKGFGWWIKECEERNIDIISTGVLSINSLQENTEPPSPSTPWLKDGLFGAGIGLIISFVIAVLLHIFDNKVRSEEELQKITGAKNMAYISNKK